MKFEFFIIEIRYIHARCPYVREGVKNVTFFLTEISFYPSSLKMSITNKCTGTVKHICHFP